MAELMQEFSGRLAALVEAAAPSVVRVEGRRGAASSGIVWADGVVTTAQHALEWDDQVQVGLPDGRTVGAKVAGRDAGTDLAVLRAEANGLTAATWTGLDSARVGHLVLAISRPGRTAQARLGILSALGQEWRAPAGGRLDRYLQADVALHPGFSGSLLVDGAGRGLGLNTAGLRRGAALAVPASTLRRVVESLLAHGEVRRGFLGVGTQPVRLPAPLEREVGQALALIVLSVQNGSPAEKAGLLLGDVLTTLDGTTLGHPADLLALLEEERIGREATLRVVRAGRALEVPVTIGAREGRA